MKKRIIAMSTLSLGMMALAATGVVWHNTNIVSNATAATVHPQQSFEQKLLPSITKYNKIIAHSRSKLLALQQVTTQPTTEELSFIKKISQLYNVPLVNNEVTPAWFKQALLQVNVIPASLALAQGADESSWGRSRFAQEANNYFGQWCFTANCGVIPKERPKNATYEVAKFSSVDHSVEQYLLNINSNKTYQKIWEIREERQQKGESVTNSAAAQAEANGLLRYSTRGEAYVKDIQNIIRLHFSKKS